MFYDWGIIYTRKGLDIDQITDLNHKKIAVIHGDIHYDNLRKLTEQFRLDCRFIEALDYGDIFELDAKPNSLLLFKLSRESECRSSVLSL